MNESQGLLFYFDLTFYGGLRGSVSGIALISVRQQEQERWKNITELANPAAHGLLFSFV